MTYNLTTDDAGTKKLVPEGSAVAALADDLANKRNLLEMAQEAEKAAHLDVDVAEAKLFDAMEAQNLTTIKTPRGLFRLNDLAWASIEDRDQARQWAEDNLPEAITINATRLAVIVRQLLKAGEPLPPGVGYRLSRKITWRP